MLVMPEWLIRLWTLGKRLKNNGVPNPFELLNQAIVEEHLNKAKESFKLAAREIERNGTPEELPPIIVCILGKGKTAQGHAKCSIFFLTKILA